MGGFNAVVSGERAARIALAVTTRVTENR
jgi:hypothetical protein